MKQFDIEKVYNAYCQLSKLQRKAVLSRLNEKGMHLTAIEAYTYPEAPLASNFDVPPKESRFLAVPY